MEALESICLKIFKLSLRSRFPMTLRKERTRVRVPPRLRLVRFTRLARLFLIRKVPRRRSLSAFESFYTMNAIERESRDGVPLLRVKMIFPFIVLTRTALLPNASLSRN